MIESNSVTVRGLYLLATLARSPHDIYIKIIREIVGPDGQRELWVRKFPPATICLHLSFGAEYEGVLRKGKFRFIREIKPPRSNPKLDEHYWDDRAVIRFHTDQTACVPFKIKQKARGDVWDRMLQRSPIPQSWKH